eukprot:gnl/TRDRNA2_/TRDRNA2_102973_c0_seq1.p1 gnl/TRDRNA2_/TRDRNA2_102973_c0~~gnl/TRDRNA2_/TRDRNA2_102973_c0_seq1.p1  ORF type:complete len:109 (+),score=1.37 gnl/TRDRNA2_/TRDRNA2_102973_c0_seq1:459-785(+)
MSESWLQLSIECARYRTIWSALALLPCFSSYTWLANYACLPPGSNQDARSNMQKAVRTYFECCLTLPSHFQPAMVAPLTDGAIPLAIEHLNALGQAGTSHCRLDGIPV